MKAWFGLTFGVRRVNGTGRRESGTMPLNNIIK